MWRDGCIIRSRFLNDIRQAHAEMPNLENLLLADFFAKALKQADAGLRMALMFGIERCIHSPALSSALAYYDGYRTARLPANLLQATRLFLRSCLRADG
ncbi:MAG: hypothetical protein ACXV7J_11730 [Methylomonas sp.]